ncbi:MAG: flagellar hook-associated protein FlgK [Sulfuricella sp.]
MSGIFGIGITGLRAAQIGLTTAGHNITNAATPGYHRQEIVQSANTPLLTGSGFIGQGTNVDTVKRIYSQFLDRQVQTAQTQSSYLETYSAQINQIDNMLADPNAGLSPSLQQFFQGVHDVAANPASVPSRQSMISSAAALVTRFQTLNQRFVELRDGVNSQISASTGIINSYAQQIAELNQRVIIAEAGSNGQPPNDILDQRDKLIADLNKEVNVTVVKQSDGAYNIFIGQGQALVVGQQAFSLTARPSQEDPERMDVAYVSNGNTTVLPQDSLDGGNLGGLLAFRAETLDKAQNELGRVAIGLAQTFNDQHRLGQDLNGNPGGDFFNVAAPKVVPNSTNTAGASAAVTISDVSGLTASDYRLRYDGATTSWSLFDVTKNQTVAMTGSGTVASPFVADGLSIVVSAPTVPANNASFLIEPTRNGARDIGVAISDTAKIAAAAPIVAQTDNSSHGGTGNIGSGKISAGVVNPPPPTNAALQNNVTIAFIDATHFSVTDNTTATVLAASVVYDPATVATVSYNGWTVELSGAPAAGDSFTVGPNTGGVSDNRNALLLAGLQTKSTLAGGTASYQSAYSQLVSSIGVKSRDINVTAQAQASLVEQSQQAQQSMSGVNLDEEAANLLRYQQAYQASGKMMQIASTLFDTLLSLGQ